MFGPRELAHPFRLSVLAVSAIVLLGCAARDRNYPEFRAEVAELKACTTPAAGRIVATSEVRSSPGALETSWTIDTRMPWNEYKSWLTKSMLAGWTARNANAAPAEAALVFSRTLTNELFFLRTTRIAGQEPARVHVSFQAIAD